MAIVFAIVAIALSGQIAVNLSYSNRKLIG